MESYVDNGGTNGDELVVTSTGGGLTRLTEYYTSPEYGPTKGIAEQANMGPATTIIDGFATGMYSAGLPVIVIVIGILCAFGFAGGARAD